LYPLLEAKHISHSFDYELFNDIHITVNAHDTIAIRGVSGSGKSTFLNILSTFLKPKSGEVFINNQNIYTLKEQQLVDMRADKIGVVFQFHYLLKGLSAYENLQTASIISKSEIDDNLLKKLKIDHVMHQKVTELSGGQQQRISIARVLTKKPTLIFADEPTGNLDEETAKDVMDELFNYVKINNAALVMVTHDKNIANQCQKIYELTKNHLILEE